MFVTYNPIKEPETFTIKDILSPLPKPKPGEQIILSKRKSDEKNSFVLLTDIPAASVAKARGYDSLYRIDMTKHNIKFECELNTKNPLQRFIAKITMTCEVADPMKVLSAMIKDVAAHVQAIVQAELNQTTAAYDADSYSDAVLKVNNRLESIRKEISEFRIQNVAVLLEINEEAKSVVQEQQKIKQQKTLSALQAELDKQNKNQINDILEGNWENTVFLGERGQELAAQIKQLKEDEMELERQRNKQLGDRDMDNINRTREWVNLQVHMIMSTIKLMEEMKNLGMLEEQDMVKRVDSLMNRIDSINMGSYEPVSLRGDVKENKKLKEGKKDREGNG